MRVRLDRIGTAAFRAVAEGSGGEVVVDGSPEIGGEGRGMRPMEVMLTAIASCGAMDVVHILRKQREPLESLRVEIEGDRADATPAPFTAIRIVFVANAAVDGHKLERAVSLAVEKYCSATASLDPAITVRFESRRE
ncbi:OsmC/Ohr family protein [Sandaracinus amylolyticus]|uniref:OsmC/Ohr family protein n=2 Tax=Sandaracinus amylolyticus TaxID=927083 RepID=A0A0F6W2W4_9BACT|nr:OsmC/Ohr family protein [Sandaracinus amylolyticus]